MLVSLDMGEFIIKKELWIFTFSEGAEHFIFIKTLKLQVKSEPKLCLGEEKNPAYKRHRISPPMLIETQITKETFFWGGRLDGHTDVLRNGGVLTCHARELNLGVNFDQFMAILVL